MLKYDLWIHDRTGSEYVLLSEGKVKINDVWEASVNYQRISFKETDDTETIYTRTKTDFLKNFKPKI